MQLVRSLRSEVLSSLTVVEFRLFELNDVFDASIHRKSTDDEASLSLGESRALRPGEGPPRPLPRPTLPLRGRVKQKRNFRTGRHGEASLFHDAILTLHDFIRWRDSNFPCFLQVSGRTVSAFRQGRASENHC